MYCTKYLIFVSSLCLALVSSLVYSIPAPSSDDDISPAHGPVFVEKRWDCEKCPAKTVTDTCTITKTDTCTITKTKTCTETETETETKTCTLTKTKTDISKIPLTVTDTVTKTCFETKYVYRTATSTKDNTLTHEQTVVNEKTNTVTSKQTNTVTDKEVRDVTVTVTDKVTTTEKVTVKVTDKVTDTVTKTETKTATTTVLPCNKPVQDTPCDSPMFAFVSPESGQVLERNKDFEVKYNITKLTGDKVGFVDDLQFYLVSSDLHCINQTIARDANTTPTRVCNKSLQYTIPACAKVPPGYYAIQVMYNFCDSTSGKDECVFHECKRGVVVK